ncbi:inorganic pyrophosphatase [Lysinibacillus sp. G4S2]|uniref:inorganic pyrophosphatase n=1 Tax=Lysinibacillus sp. G4S2 TaxID=3055859 RepID=UPI0025A14CBB|nr:inorganic pyrophosphatase [Lysinibacillus sp. G4S2]MDM5247774.1 inorganic pyrophosphatase [Lysinibacillus sp. G4S2]
MKSMELIVTIDRPIGYVDNYNNVYPINYGYIPGLIGGDAEEQDAYIISKRKQEPLESFTGNLVAIIHRNDDIEDKWVVGLPNEEFSVEEIWEQVSFMEQYFDAVIEIIK